MGLRKDNRASISFSEIGDADLLKILREVDYNFAGFCKDLMRDGLKYRGIVNDSKPPNSIPSVPNIRTGVVKKQISTTVDKEELKKRVSEKFDKL